MLHCAADPMNQLVVKLVREQGVRDAVGITDGVSRLGNTLVTIPGFRGPLPLALTGAVTEVRQDPALGPVFDLAAYE
jgi:hypothetical protein